MPRVLVVEDEPTDNQFLTMTVRGLGHPVESCLDGQAAVAWVRENTPSLVFLDALLPKLDGFAVLQEIRRLHPDVPVYMMSGVYKKKSYEQEAVAKLGATAYLHKPLSVLHVWEILERTLPPVPGSEIARDFPGVPFWRRPLPAVVGDLHLGEKTGLLFVRGSGGSGILFFEDGQLVFGRCNDPQLRIDRVLLQLGKLKREQLAKVSEIASGARGRIGDALVAEGLITAADLSEALAMQQRNHATRPLTWTHGSCWFLPSEAPRNESFKMQIDAKALIFWACRHLEVDDHLIRFLPRPERTIRCTLPVRDLVQPFGLSSDEAALISLADGSRTIGQLRAIGRMMQIDVERILAALVSLQLIELGPEPGPKPALAPLFGSSVPVAGDLSRFSPALLLVSMAFSRKTGILQLEAPANSGVGRVHSSVHFSDGDIAFATSSDPSDRIGQVLLRIGAITREQLHQALAAAQASPASVPIGRVLVASGVLAPDDLHGALLHQAQQVVTGIAGWARGAFRFQENDGPGKDIVPLGLDTRQAVMTALRTCPFSDLAPRLPSPQTRLRSTATAHQLAADLPLTPLEARLRQEADGSRTVQEIAGDCEEGPEAALRAIFTLTTIGLVEGFLLPQGTAPPPPRAGTTTSVAVGAISGPAGAPPARAARAPGPALAPSLDDTPDPAMTGESTAERTRRARVLSLDESFEGTSETREEAPAASAPSWGETSFAEDWSATGEASFAELGDDAAAATADPPLEVAPGSVAAGVPAPSPSLREDWSAPEECSFAGLAEAAARPPAEGELSLEAILGEMGMSLDGALSLDGGPGWASTGAATATAVAAPLLTATQVEATCEFLVLLAGWLRTCPEAVPESVLAKLPPDVRAMFGL